MRNIGKVFSIKERRPLKNKWRASEPSAGILVPFHFEAILIPYVFILEARRIFKRQCLGFLTYIHG